MANKELTDASLAPVLDKFRQHLMAKNVAQDIAQQLCDSVKAGLVGKTHSTFTRVAATVKAQLEEALTRILTPRHTIDILRDVRQAEAEKRPYSIVFVGVNGVGKSTTLSKAHSSLLLWDRSRC